ncbi:2-oxoacid dehydrogenase multienzyme complex, dihydrolipoamide dehydrogenase (E3) component [Candidatus Mancarchaeum acidiphilum]|uniref:2-oxoacid dehydrogenase multienzyme complex, dihydrolipoamide dehydrogenase (E3) component n=1 Tax=Candidatus Mancarchaeum acidiphilum TaxID=1920749 RepID=A0A218NN17_9ARCH|nr:FAD-dependent oxidoreductase [Candidatus Mancarchaeum acidiphilum]ASI13861.1 2-oxoacid dehydrogenase multienzyme complex, dihydrolipoamide dehydrogenase (E3) component [Candidatus Mancarchaeum acidiphilum]
MGVVGSLPEEVDVVVIGGGAGGYTAAIRAAELGKSVALVEADKLGGSCLNYTCIPAATMINIADKFQYAKGNKDLGITGSPQIDFKKAHEYRMGVSKKLSSGVESLCKMHGIEVFNAMGSFLSSNSLQLSDGVTLNFKKAIIATGTKLEQPEKLKVDGVKVLDHKSVLSLDYIPKSVAIVNDDYAAIEFSSMFAKLGSKVYVISEKGIFSRIDQELIAVPKKKLADMGVEVYEKDPIKSYSDGKITLESGKEITADIIALSPERVPYTEGLGLDNTKVQLNEKGYIKVDSHLQTTDPNIYASGDIVGQPMSATKALRQGVIAGESASGLNSEFDNVVVPETILSDPEIAVVGKLSGDGIKTIKFPFSASGRAIADDATEGFTKIAYDENGVVKGVGIVGQNADVVIGEATLAIEMSAMLEDIADTIHPHPTMSEGLEEAAEGALGRPIDFYVAPPK